MSDTTNRASSGATAFSFGGKVDRLLSLQAGCPLPQKAILSGSVATSDAVDRCQVNQDDPPAEIPAASTVAAHCPKCSQKLNPPLKTSGRQICVKCGWSNQPRPPQAHAPVGEAAMMRLLQQATAESLDNMKPRKKQS